MRRLASGGQVEEVILQAGDELNLEENCCSGSHGSRWWKSLLPANGRGQYGQGLVVDVN